MTGQKASPRYQDSISTCFPFFSKLAYHSCPWAPSRRKHTESDFQRQNELLRELLSLPLAVFSPFLPPGTPETTCNYKAKMRRCEPQQAVALARPDDNVWTYGQTMRLDDELPDSDTVTKNRSCERHAAPRRPSVFRNPQNRTELKRASEAESAQARQRERPERRRERACEIHEEHVRSGAARRP